MKLELHEHPALFAQLQAEWNDLLKRSPADSIFSTWEWQSTWWDAYQPGQLWVVTCRDENGQLVGIAPCFIDPEGVVRGIGCEDVTDYIDFIVDGAYLDTVYNELAAYFASCRSQFKAIEICNIPQESPTYQHFPHILEEHQFSASTEQQEVVPLIELPADWEGFLNLLDKKQRHEVRRKMRKIGTVDIDWYQVGPEHHLEEELQKFLKLMAASDAEKRAFLENPAHVTFFKRFVEIAHEKGWLWLCFLNINGEAVAAYLNFDYNNQVLVYNSGQLHGQHDSLSPGIVLLAYTIRAAIERGYAVFNFLRGDEVYKYRMGAHDTHIYKLSAHLNQN
ncbi:MAG: GNAT family N-acetyltransferase [Anaerolineae bacterium]